MAQTMDTMSLMKNKEAEEKEGLKLVPGSYVIYIFMLIPPYSIPQLRKVLVFNLIDCCTLFLFLAPL